MSKLLEVVKEICNKEGIEFEELKKSLDKENELLRDTNITDYQMSTSQALAIKKGDCDDFSKLAYDLLNEEGIPTYMVELENKNSAHMITGIRTSPDKIDILDKKDKPLTYLYLPEKKEYILLYEPQTGRLFKNSKEYNVTKLMRNNQEFLKSKFIQRTKL